MAIPLSLVLSLLIGVVCAAPTARGTDTTSETQSSVTENVPIGKATQATPFSIGMRVTVRPGATYWEGASNNGCGRHGIFSENNIYLSGKETFINGITVVDKDGSPRNTVFMTRDSVLLDGNRWSYSPGDATGQVMVHICVPNFVPGDLGWVSLTDVDPYVDPLADNGSKPEEAKPETTTAAPDTTAANSGSTDSSTKGICKWLPLLLVLLALTAAILFILWRRKTMTTAQAVDVIADKNLVTACLLDASGSVSPYSEAIAKYAKKLENVDTIIIFGKDSKVIRPENYTTTEIDRGSTDIWRALNLLGTTKHYDSVVIVTDGDDNCNTNLKARSNIDSILILTPKASVPWTTRWTIKTCLTRQVKVMQLQD